MLLNEQVLSFVSSSDNCVQLVDAVTATVYAEIRHTETTNIILTDTFFQMPVSYEKKQDVAIMLFEHARSIARANHLADSIQITISIHAGQPVRAMAGLLMCASSGMSFS